MTSNALKNVSGRAATSTPQTSKAVKGQKKNQAGGYTFVISDMERVKRFLILGSEASFYSSAQKLSEENAKTIIKLAEDPEAHRAMVDLVVTVSTEGRAPKQDPGLFALAILSTHGTDEARAYANSVLPQVARTASTLFSYVSYRDQFGGRSMGFRKSVQRWYLDRSANSLAYQGVKYRQREGWTHRDLLRAVRPSGKVMNEDQKAVFDYLVHGKVDTNKTPAVIAGYEAAKKNFSVAQITEYGLTWDMLPTDVLTRKDVWAALLDADNVPLGALIRNLSRLTTIGLLGDLEQKYTALVVSRLTDAERIEKSRIHPLTILTAQHTYGSGRSAKGSGMWKPVRKVVSALDKAFYMAFKNVEPTGKRFLLGLDVSGSMGVAFGESGLTSRDAATAMALVTAATEDYVHTIGFTGSYTAHGGGYGYYGRRDSSTAAQAVKVLNINPDDTLATNVSRTANLPFGPTDCALPMVYAMEQGLEVDVFVVYTDNDTWVGRVHPFEALKQYRKKTGIDAKLIVLSTMATRFSIADPNDPGMLDIPGWDSAAPQVISEFARGL